MWITRNPARDPQTAKTRRKLPSHVFLKHKPEILLALARVSGLSKPTNHSQAGKKGAVLVDPEHKGKGA